MIFVLEIWNHDGLQCERTTVNSTSEYQYTGVIFLSSFKFKHLIGRYFTNMVYTIRMYFPINSTSTNREKMRSIKSHICHLFSEGGEVFFEKKKRCCMALITRVVSGGDVFFFQDGIFGFTIPSTPVF